MDNKGFREAEESYRQRANFASHLAKHYANIAAKDPERLKRKVRGLGYLGYLLVGGLVLVPGAYSAYLFVLASSYGRSAPLKWGLLLAWFALSVARAAWVRIDRKDYGVPVSRDEAPNLWSEVDRVAKLVESPPVDRIVIDLELNASAAMLPKAGPFGGYTCVLSLGLPLLAGQTVEESLSTIGHELGHFSGAHGRTSLGVYRLMQTWDRLDDMARSNSGLGSWIIGKLAKWFVPRFHAASMALRRTNEREADAAAGKTVGAETAALALVRLRGRSAILDGPVWNGLMRDFCANGKLPVDAAHRWLAFYSEPLPDFVWRGALRSARSNGKPSEGTHPEVWERVRDLWESGFDDDTPQPEGRSGWESLFENHSDSVLERLLEWWWDEENYREYADSAKEMVATYEKGEIAKDEVERLLAVARCLPLVKGEDDALAFVREIRQNNPNSRDAFLREAELLLDRDDPDGLAMVNEAASKGWILGEEPRKSWFLYLLRQGEDEEAERVRSQNVHDYIAERFVDQATDRIDPGKDTLLAHGLTEEQIQAIVAEAPKVKGLKRLYAVRKETFVPGVEPVLVFVGVAGLLHESFTLNSHQKLAERAVEQLPVPAKSIMFIQPSYVQSRRMARMHPEALIWPKKP